MGRRVLAVSPPRHWCIPRWIFVLLVCWATMGSLACQRWTTAAESPFQELDPIEEEGDLLVVLRSGQHIRLSRPIEVIDGSVSGLSHHNPNGQDFRRAQRVIIPLADVEELRVRRTDEVATSLLVVGGVTGVLVGTFYLFAQEVD